MEASAEVVEEAGQKKRIRIDHCDKNNQQHPERLMSILENTKQVIKIIYIK